MKIMKPCFVPLFSMLLIINSFGQQSKNNAQAQQDTTAGVYHMKNFGVTPYERKTPDCSIVYEANESEPRITCELRGKPDTECENRRRGKREQSGLKPGELKIDEGAKSKKNRQERMSGRKNI